MHAHHACTPCTCRAAPVPPAERNGTWGDEGGGLGRRREWEWEVGGEGETWGYGGEEGEEGEEGEINNIFLL